MLLSLDKKIRTHLRTNSILSKFYYWLDRLWITYLVNKYLKPETYEIEGVTGIQLKLGQATITHVAIYIPSHGKVYCIRSPAHHHNIIFLLIQRGLWNPKKFYKTAKEGAMYEVQGFLTSEYKFVGRKKAAKVAKAAGQIEHDSKYLFSEDMWHLSDDVRFKNYFDRYK